MCASSPFPKACYIPLLTFFFWQGFKSYAVRTAISGWDPLFNSITGLNGSGKSNILDSICFVLGITNMTTVRAQNLQVCAPLPICPRGYTDKEMLGSHLQAWTSWSNESKRHNRLRQSRQKEVPHRIRRICPNQRHPPNPSRRNEQIP